MRVTDISFQRWLETHSAEHKDRWFRELYPWEILSEIDFSKEKIGEVQVMEGTDATYRITLKKIERSHDERYVFTFSVVTEPFDEGQDWYVRSWRNDFELVCSAKGVLITLYAVGVDPSAKLVKSFMRGEFKNVVAERSLPVFSLLHRSLTSYALEKAYPELSLHKTFNTIKGTPRKLGQPNSWPTYTRPLLADDRNHWVMCATSEEFAHRLALLNEHQCDQLTVVYCLPNFSQHHRYDGKVANVISLPAALQNLGDSAGKFLRQFRFLLNWLTPTQPRDEEDMHRLLTVPPKKPDDPVPIKLCELREARAALDLDVSNVREAAYFFACANLLNTAINRARNGKYDKIKLDKRHYSYKGRIAEVARQLLSDPIPGVNIAKQDDLLIAEVSDVQFSFHEIPLEEFGPKLSKGSWRGVRLQPLAPLALEWARKQVMESIR